MNSGILWEKQNFKNFVSSFLRQEPFEKKYFFDTQKLPLVQVLRPTYAATSVLPDVILSLCLLSLPSLWGLKTVKKYIYVAITMLVFADSHSCILACISPTQNELAVLFWVKVDRRFTFSWNIKSSAPAEVSRYCCRPMPLKEYRALSWKRFCLLLPS